MGTRSETLFDEGTVPKEKNIQARIALHVGSKPDARVFRNNTGMGFQGTVVKETPDMVTLKNHRRIQFGLVKGSSDLIGFVTRIIRQSDVGKRVAQFLAVECKTPKKGATDPQKNFISVVKQFGGLAGVAKTPKDAEEIINQWDGTDASNQIQP